MARRSMGAARMEMTRRKVGAAWGVGVFVALLAATVPAAAPEFLYERAVLDSSSD